MRFIKYKRLLLYFCLTIYTHAHSYKHIHSYIHTHIYSFIHIHITKTNITQSYDIILMFLLPYIKVLKIMACGNWLYKISFTIQKGKKDTLNFNTPGGRVDGLLKKIICAFNKVLCLKI